MKVGITCVLICTLFWANCQSSVQGGFGVLMHKYEEVVNVEYQQDCPTCMSYIYSWDTANRISVSPAYNVGFHHSFKPRKNLNFRFGLDFYYSEYEYKRALIRPEPSWPYKYLSSAFEHQLEVEFAIPLQLEYQAGRTSIYAGPSIGSMLYRKYRDVNAWQVHYLEEYLPKYLIPKINIELGFDFKPVDRFRIGLNNRYNVLNRSFMSTINIGYYLPTK